MTFNPSNYPDGHPTGTQTTHFTVACKGCGETVEVTQVYERDTNAGWLEPEDGCPHCGEEWTDGSLKDAEPYEPEPDYDAMYEAQYERQMMEDEEDRHAP